MNLAISNVEGLGVKEQEMLRDLVDIYNYHKTNNDIKERYYDGNITLREVNLGIALPRTYGKLTVGCNWGAKCVDVLASRSMFDGFVSSSGNDIDTLNQIIDGNHLISQYMKACKDELKFGCTFATLSKEDVNGCKIRFHSPQSASARWDGGKGRIDCGMAIIDTVPDEKDDAVWYPSHINLYTDTDVWEIKRDKDTWVATRHPHIMGMPLIVPMIWDKTSAKPFGRSRLKYPIRALIDGYIRSIANASIALEFSTTPQKYILGLTDEQFDAVVNDKFKQYMGSILASTTNPETGENPTVGQFSQGSLSPHIEMIRILATQFSAATGLTVTDTGVINDANPTSSDAILAQSQTLVLLAEQLNASNGDALKLIAQMALAIANDCRISDLSSDVVDVVAHFKNPAMPSVSVTADAAIKIASAREGFADTSVFLEMLGFSQADIRRIKSQEQKARGLNVLSEINYSAPEEE